MIEAYGYLLLFAIFGVALPIALVNNGVIMFLEALAWIVIAIILWEVAWLRWTKKLNFRDIPMGNPQVWFFVLGFFFSVIGAGSALVNLSTFGAQTASNSACVTPTSVNVTSLNCTKIQTLVQPPTGGPYSAYGPFGSYLVLLGEIGLPTFLAVVLIIYLYVRYVKPRKELEGNPNAQPEETEEKDTDLSKVDLSKSQPVVIASASVKDVSLPAPFQIPGATKDEIREIGIGAAIIGIAFAVFTGVLWYYFKSTTVDQINFAMPLIVQLDSFLTGGWVIGFFYYWGSWEKALRASKKARRALRGHPKDAIQFKDADRAKLYLHILAKEKELTPTSKLFIELIGGVLMFIVSAISAVFAVLTYALLPVQLALNFMVGGVLLMAFSWVVLRYVTQRLRDLTDAALELGD